ncbi:hypothetical protein RVBP21_2920 [Pseudomonas phage BRkr]|nr:hypothetical protein RVBP21_2920 [Pseudomonas phage BRkr]
MKTLLPDSLFLVNNDEDVHELIKQMYIKFKVDMVSPKTILCSYPSVIMATVSKEYQSPTTLIIRVVPISEILT